jgi:monothiol glutaredoxin
MDQQTRERIQKIIDENDVVLFMKGTPEAPRCGFSATVVQILGSVGSSFASVDVLGDPAVRDGIKEFSDWPTIPQLYVKREFIGGADIVKELYGTGELEEKLGGKIAEIAVPNVTVTTRAAEALKAAVESGDDGIRVEIGPQFQYGLSIGPKQPRDVVVETLGLTLLLDRASAKRADGTVIDHITTPEGAAFKISNPNEPPKVKQVAPRELAERLRSGEKVSLYDVRTPQEQAKARIEGAKLLDRSTEDEILALPKNTPLVFHCHHGSRSQQAAEHFLAQGFTNVSNLSGGIDAWSVEVDDGVSRY